MCLYILLTPLCAHAPTLLAGPSCPRVWAELNRIHGAEAWRTAEARASLPFEWPDACLPREGNVRVVPTGRWCGWECRNSHSLGMEEGATGQGSDGDGGVGAGGVSTTEGRMGVPGARYGVERPGVGWREG
ncbi:Uu.00g079500.m01.CDS01 [Anthostomella pinea]|uniref:Uu.00g079500.m01.CDS01 n=1 Tax=Anthostomella pinea TaxID=933095 RepID=A0AAI8YGU2_9PEZI|nr:Uu.00g079500.m01.CDS01 [Anthostomella pinea]